MRKIPVGPVDKPLQRHLSLLWITCKPFEYCHDDRLISLATFSISHFGYNGVILFGEYMIIFVFDEIIILLCLLILETTCSPSWFEYVFEEVLDFEKRILDVGLECVGVAVT